MAKDICLSPFDADSPPAGYKGGPGEYNGEPGFQKRTATPNGPDEKTYENLKERKPTPRGLNETE